MSRNRIKTSILFPKEKKEYILHTSRNDAGNGLLVWPLGLKGLHIHYYLDKNDGKIKAHIKDEKTGRKNTLITPLQEVENQIIKALKEDAKYK